MRISGANKAADYRVEELKQLACVERVGWLQFEPMSAGVSGMSLVFGGEEFKLDMYYGVAWEYEFNGDANNTVVGYELATPSLEGSTVIGELGAHYKANEKWSFDLNARSYAGQRDGFSGSLQANYSF